MKNLLLIILVSTFLFSCNKNQKVNRKISGEWQYQGVTTTANATDIYTAISDGHTINYNFQNCNLKNNDYCSLIITDVLSTTENEQTITTQSIYSQIYKIYSDGAIIEIKDELSDSTTQTYLISELNDQKLIFTYYQDGSRVDLDFYKVE